MHVTEPTVGLSPLDIAGWTLPKADSLVTKAITDTGKRINSFPPPINSLPVDTRIKLSIVDTILAAAKPADKSLETIYICKSDDWPEAVNKIIAARQKGDSIHLVGYHLAENARNPGEFIWLEQQVKSGKFFITDIFAPKNLQDSTFVAKPGCQPLLLGLKVPSGQEKTELLGAPHFAALVNAIDEGMQIRNAPVKVPVPAPKAELLPAT